MEPTLDANSIIVLQPAQPKDICVGDIISYNGNESRHKHFKGNNILHRVIGKRHGMWLLKGDNNKEHDGWIRHKYFLGRYIGHVNYKKSNKDD